MTALWRDRNLPNRRSTAVSGSQRVAVVEDDAALRQNYADVFARQGYQVEGYSDRVTAVAAFTAVLPDLVVVDIGLGDEVDGGFMLCQWLRAQSGTLPIIIVSARDDDYDIVSGLRMGADDYVTKDVSLPNLVARVAALFRRVEAMREFADPARFDRFSNRLSVGDLDIDGDRISCQFGGAAVDLTLTEFWMVWSLVEHPGHVRSRDQLMQGSHIVVDDATITTHVKRIRRKFKAVAAGFTCIESVYGLGYRWNADNV